MSLMTDMILRSTAASINRTGAQLLVLLGKAPMYTEIVVHEERLSWGSYVLASVHRGACVGLLFWSNSFR
jgi:hypothetical protein